MSCKDETRQQTLESRGQHWNNHDHGRTEGFITIASRSHHDSMSAPNPRLRVMCDALKQYPLTPGETEAPQSRRFKAQEQMWWKKRFNRVCTKSGAPRILTGVNLGVSDPSTLSAFPPFRHSAFGLFNNQHRCCSDPRHSRDDHETTLQLDPSVND